MSEEIEVTDNEVTENTENKEFDVKEILEQAKAPKEEKEEKPFDPKKDKVEFSTPEQLARFKAIEAQRNASDQRNRMYWDMIQEQQKRLETLEGRVKQEDTVNAEKVILDRLKNAQDEGNTEELTKAIDDLVKFRASASEKQEKKEQKVNIPQEISPDYQYVADLASETDENGNPLRPWLLDGGAQSPEIIKRAEELAAELSQANPNDPYLVPKVFKILDKEFSQPKPKEKPNNRAIDPLQGSNLTQQQQRGTMKLSDQEIAICAKLGVKPEKYLAQQKRLGMK